MPETTPLRARCGRAVRPRPCDRTQAQARTMDVVTGADGVTDGVSRELGETDGR